jgi:hypothetical protein
MSTEEKIKELISKKLTSFLLSRKSIPSEIRVAVEYPLSTAILRIDAREIGSILREEVQE